MGLFNNKSIAFVKEEIAQLEGVRNREAFKHQAIKRGFMGRARYAFLLIGEEKEIIVFSLLQVLVIAAAYFLWTQMLDWIPESVWKSVADSKEQHSSIVDVILLLWSFFCVGLAAFPLGILSGCIGASHFLRRAGKPSTIEACFDIVLSNAGAVWIFNWIDGWITVNQILERCPRKKDRRTAADKALSETLYYAWKLGTMGVLPSLITGTNLIESGKNAINVVKVKLEDLSKLRLGYSALCWIVGVAAYIGAVFAIIFLDPFPHKNVAGKMYALYIIIGLPIFIAAAIIQIFLRPIYVISLCDIYSDYLAEKGETPNLPNSPQKSIIPILLFMLILFGIAYIFFYRYQLGIMDKLATPYTN